jgi:hypothetical protein
MDRACLLARSPSKSGIQRGRRAFQLVRCQVQPVPPPLRRSCHIKGVLDPGVKFTNQNLTS